MVNPRYKPFNGNSRKPAVKQPEKKLSETKTDFVYPPKEEYIGPSIRGEYGGVNLSNPHNKKYYKGMI